MEYIFSDPEAQLLLDLIDTRLKKAADPGLRSELQRIKRYIEHRLSDTNS